MKKVLLMIFVLFLGLSAGVINKSKFDLEKPGLAKSATSNSGPFDYRQINNETIELTLISGGYFTIGTNNGNSENRLDDNCSVTFGHPYAKTSYPVFSVDGSWYKFDEYFFSSSDFALSNSGDTLKVSATQLDLFTIEFLLIYDSDNQDIKLTNRIINVDNQTHSFGLGFVIDPALGKWGDGFLELDGNFLKRDTLISSIDSGSHMAVWERAQGAKGIGFDISFDEDLPDQIAVANWADIYNNQSPEFEENILRKLYDLALKMSWYEEELAPGGEKNCQTSIKLKQPDFSSVAFLRWDLQNYISNEDNQLFPRSFKTYLEISNQNEISINDGEINLAIPNGFSSSSSHFVVSVPQNQTVFREVFLASNIVYEDLILELSVQLKNNSQVIDELNRNVFLPATQFSDTGLIVTDDSLSVVDFPEVNLIFAVEAEETGQKILDLSAENVFLYENDKRIRDFNIGKYLIGGSNLADVAFVLDCSGSMGDNIEDVRTNLDEFADSLAAKGFDYQIGVVTFSTTVDDVWDFTNNIDQVKSNLASIELWGGVEDSPAALYKASELSWRPDSRRTIIWITDEPYPEHSYTQEQIVDRMLIMGITVHGVGQTNLQTDWFNPIVLPTGGNFYDIYGNFRDILLDVTNFGSQFLYSLNYESPNTSSSANEIKLEIHYQGLGGSKLFNYQPQNNIASTSSLTCFPNPFNPEITFKITNQNYVKGDLSIFNILGQRVKKISLGDKNNQKIVWNAYNDQGRQVVSGFYIVQLSLINQKGEVQNESARILYLK